MSLGKQIKLKLIDRFNKVVLPLMEFKTKIGYGYSEKFSGTVKIDKLKLYNPAGPWSSNRYMLVVDVTVKGIILSRKCFRDEFEVTKMIAESNSHLSLYSSTSQILFTKQYDSKDKKRKTEMTSKIKTAIEDEIVEKIKVMTLKEAVKPLGYQIDKIKIGKIKYE